MKKMFKSVCSLCTSRKMQSISRSQRFLQTGRLLLNQSFKSAYSLDNLYPESNPDPTAQLKEPPSDVYQRLHGKIEGADDKFSGYIPVDKLTIRKTRSSGAGGQSVNKVESKVDMRFHVASAEWLPEHIRNAIIEKKSSKISKSGELIITSEKTRSQMKNFQDCMQKLREMIDEVQRKPKEPSEEDKHVKLMRQERASQERLRQKSIHSMTKKSRQVTLDD